MLDKAILRSEILEKLQSEAFCKKLLSLGTKAEVKELFKSEGIDIRDGEIELLAEGIKALISLEKEDLEKIKELKDMDESELANISGGADSSMTTSDKVQITALQAMLLPLAASVITYAKVEKATGSKALATLACLPVGLASAVLILPPAAVVAGVASVGVWFNNLE